MLERAPSCLEQGGRRLLDASRKSIRSQRSLHSAFWCHGASEIDLPSWWIALLQQPPPEHSMSRRSIAETAKSYLTAGLGDTGFLDFLYPAKTLSLIHKLAVRDPALLRQRQRHQSSTAYRAYTSEATGERVAVDSDSDHAAHLVDALRKIEEVDNPDPKLGDLTRRRRIHEGECSRAFKEQGSLSELSNRDVHDTFTHLSRLKSAGSTLLQDYGEQVLRLLKEKLGVEAKWQPKHYAMGISSWIFCGEYDKAMDMYREALDNFQDHLATPLIIRLAIENKAWQLGTEAWFAYSETVQAESFFWSGLIDMDCHQLFRNAIELGEFAKADRHSADTYLRGFSIKLIENIFGLRDIKVQEISAFNHYTLFMRLRTLVRQPTEHQYRLAINQCLSMRFAPKDQRLRTFGDNAVRLYMAMRTRDDVRPDQQMLENLFKRACQVHNVDSRLIFLDIKNHFGAPSKRIYTFMLKEYEHQNDPRACYALMEEIEQQHGDVMTPALALRLLRMHAQRAEIPQAVRLFSSLRERTGEAPSSAHWNAIVLAHTRVGDIMGARDWFNMMRKRNIPRDMHTFLPLLKFFARRGDIDAVERLVSDMSSQGITGRVEIVENLIQAYLQNEDLDEAQDLLFETKGLKLEGEHVYMWNLVITAFAVRRSIDEVDYLRKSMQEAGVVANEMTYAALASALCAQKQPASAFRLVRKTMRSKSLRAMSLHFSIVMGGFVRTGQYDQVFVVYRWMVNHGIAPDIGAKTLLVRAAAMIDQQEGRKDHQNREGVLLARAEEMLAQLLESAAPSDVPRKTPVKGARWDMNETAYASNYFDFLIYIYGHARMFHKVDELYGKYIDVVRQNSGNSHDSSEIPLPIRMLVALMVYHRRADNHVEVERLWNYAVEKSQDLVIRDGANPDDANWVLPSRQYILSTPLGHYMRSLADTGRAGEFHQLFQHLLAMGYGLDSKAWNFYVQEAAFANNHLHAFVTAERNLMRDWRGWAMGQNPYIVMGKIGREQPTKFEGHRRYPTYKTLVILARSYLDVQSSSAYDDKYEALLKEIRAQAPITAKAVLEMPPLDEKLQQRLLRRG